MKILLATPAHNGQVCAGYHKAVLDTLLFFKGEYPGIEFESRIISMSLLPRVRNIYASLVLNDPSYTHLLFIDSDMSFWPELIANMLAFNKPITGVIYPKRKFDYDAYYRAGAVQGNPMLERVRTAGYIGGDPRELAKSKEAGNLVSCEVRNGFVRTRYAGTGIMLIARGVFETMRDRFPELWLPRMRMPDVGLEGGLLQCFDPLDLASENGLIQGEDFAFCRRWVEDCGGEIWANIDQPVIHIGQEGFAGKYIHKLEQMIEDAAQSRQHPRHVA